MASNPGKSGTPKDGIAAARLERSEIDQNFADLHPRLTTTKHWLPPTAAISATMRPV